MFEILWHMEVRDMQFLQVWDGTAFATGAGALSCVFLLAGVGQCLNGWVPVGFWLSQFALVWQVWQV